MANQEGPALPHLESLWQNIILCYWRIVSFDSTLQSFGFTLKAELTVTLLMHGTCTKCNQNGTSTLEIWLCIFINSLYFISSTKVYSACKLYHIDNGCVLHLFYLSILFLWPFYCLFKDALFTISLFDFTSYLTVNTDHAFLYPFLNL